VGEDVKQQEHQDAGGGGVQERLGAQPLGAHAADGQAEVDGEAGDGAEQDGLCRGHGMAPAEIGDRT